jgi:hypothetical protein
MRLVRITWHDSGMQHESGWKTPEQVENRTPSVISVGYVVHEDDENITIAQGFCIDPELYYGFHTVWKPAVKKMEEL